MTLWVLDTDSLSLLERGNPKIQERLRQVNADSVAISIVTAEEKMKGRLAAINSLSGIERIDHPWGCACAFVLLLPTEIYNRRLKIYKHYQFYHFQN
jgi:hypothetical protein